MSTKSKVVSGWPHIMNYYRPFSHRSNLLRNASVTVKGKYGSLSTVEGVRKSDCPSVVVPVFVYGFSYVYSVRWHISVDL